MTEDNRILFLISKSMNGLKKYIRKRYRAGDIDISPAQMGILFLLKGKNGQTMSELSGHLSVDNSTLTRLVDKLEKTGLVEREMNPSDRRLLHISITDSGRAMAGAAARIAREINREVTEGFNEEEIEIFKRVLTGLLEKFSE